MLRFSPVPCAEGVSGVPRHDASNIFAVDSGDNLLLNLESGICILRKGRLLIEKFVLADAGHLKDGKIDADARVGSVMDLSWDADSFFKVPDSLRPSYPNYTPTCRGLLWILDGRVLRLLHANHLFTIAGSTCDNISDNNKATEVRDGCTRMHHADREEREYATFLAPTHCFRMKSRATVVILDADPRRPHAATTVRLLNTTSWMVTTLETGKVPLPRVLHAYKNHDCLPLYQHNPNSSAIYIRTIIGDISTVDIETGKVQLSDVPAMHPCGERDLWPIVSNAPLYYMLGSLFGVVAIIKTHDGRHMATLDVQGPFAYIKASNTMAYASPNEIMVSTDCMQYRDKYGDFKPRRTNFGDEDFSIFIDNDVLPGDMVLTHDLSGRSWRVHELPIAALWPKDTVEAVVKAVKNSKLPSDIVDKYITFLHCRRIFENLEIRDKLSLALKICDRYMERCRYALEC